MVFAPRETGSHIAGEPGVNWPSAFLVQLSDGKITDRRLPRTSTRVVLMYTLSSAVTDVDEVLSSKN